MQYYVIQNDGQRFGPAGVETLNQWIADNRIGPGSMLETPDGQQVQASAVPGLNFGLVEQVTPAASYSAPPAVASPTFSQAPSVLPNTYAPAAGTQVSNEEGKRAFITSIIFSLVGLMCCWFVCPIVGIVYGSKAVKAKYPNAAVSIIVACIILGLNLVSVLVMLYQIGVSSTGGK